MSEFKLYVIGEISADPDDWSAYGSRSIVIAKSPEEAEEIAGGVVSGPAIEVVFTKPCLISHECY